MNVATGAKDKVSKVINDTVGNIKDFVEAEKEKKALKDRMLEREKSLESFEKKMTGENFVPDTDFEKVWGRVADEFGKLKTETKDAAYSKKSLKIDNLNEKNNAYILYDARN
jgi:hypothetical protein